VQVQARAEKQATFCFNSHLLEKLLGALDAREVDALARQHKLGKFRALALERQEHRARVELHHLVVHRIDALVAKAHEQNGGSVDKT
jgi:hypothetical protein